MVYIHSLKFIFSSIRPFKKKNIFKNLINSFNYPNPNTSECHVSFGGTDYQRWNSERNFLIVLILKCFMPLAFLTQLVILTLMICDSKMLSISITHPFPNSLTHSTTQPQDVRVWLYALHDFCTDGHTYEGMSSVFLLWIFALKWYWNYTYHSLMQVELQEIMTNRLAWGFRGKLHFQ